MTNVEKLNCLSYPVLLSLYSLLIFKKQPMPNLRSLAFLFFFLFISFLFSCALRKQGSSSLYTKKELTELTSKIDSLLSAEPVTDNILEKTDSLLKRIAKIISDKKLKESTFQGDYLFYKGKFHLRGKEYSKGIKEYIGSLEIRNKIFGEGSLESSFPLRDLGICYLMISQLKLAEEHLNKASEIRNRYLSESDPDRILVLGNLANLYLVKGDFEAAEAMGLKTNEEALKHLGVKNMVYYSSLNVLGATYFKLGNYEKAKKIYSKGIDSLDYYSLYLPEHEIRLLNGLAGISQATGEIQEAKELLEVVLALQEKTFGKENIDYPYFLMNNGILSLQTGKFKEAENLLLEAKTIFERDLQDTFHLRYLNILNTLAISYGMVEKYDLAEQYFLKIISARKDGFGTSNSDYYDALYTIADFYRYKDDFENSAKYFRLATDGYEQLVLRSVNHLSPSEVEKYIVEFNIVNEKVLSLGHAAYLSGNLEKGSIDTSSKYIPEIIYDNALFYKGFLESSSYKIRNYSSTDSTYQKTFSELRNFERKLSAEETKPLKVQDAAQISVLREKVNSLEKFLSKTVAGYDEEKQLIRFQEVKSNLAPDEIAIEFLRFNYYNKDFLVDSIYAALIVSQEDAFPTYVFISDAGSLESFVKTQENVSFDNLYAFDKKRSSSLYEMIWKPLLPYLTDKKTVFYAPSGILHRINFSAIGIPKGKIICQDFKTVALLNTREIINYKNKKNSFSKAKKAVLYGNPDYGKQGYWKSLKNAERELDSLSKTLTNAGISVQILSQLEASEENFKNKSTGVNAPNLLHFTAHGFFNQKTKTGGNIFQLSNNPMIRSGLVLAGANEFWDRSDTLAQSGNEGVLTALEISKVSLDSVILTILSACETGLGDIKGTEGVYGLQRAFRIAGTEKILMSLWQLPRKATETWMTQFYHYLFVDNLPPEDAYLQTQIKMKERTDDYRYWAGFVLIQ